MTIRDEDRPPIHGGRGLAVEWLQRREYLPAGLADKVALSVVYSEQSFPTGVDELRDDYWPTGAEVSWLGGPAGSTSPEQWPRTRRGHPLAHVASFDLRSAHGSLDAVARTHWPVGSEGLPDHGILQVFHDLATHGHDPADAETGAWLVRWSPEPDRALLTDGPADLDLPSRPCQVMLPYASFAIPSSADAIGAPAAVFDATEAAQDHLQRMWSWQRTTDPSAPPVPVTHLYGHAQHGALLPRHEILPACLPLRDSGDDHRLLIEIESWTTLAGWFGDAGTLQVWMRSSDLTAHAFNHAWCIIRTD